VASGDGEDEGDPLRTVSQKRGSGASRPAAAVTVAEAAPPATRLVDEGEIAEGGMSSVHKVRDGLIERHAAMKILADRVHPEARVRFLREAQITGQLDHPNIVPIYDIGQTPDGAPCFTMKLVRGRTLAEVLRGGGGAAGRGARDLEVLLKILVTVCDAVSFAHSRGVIHRDLKPDNVMIGSHGQVYVMDWGCAYVLDDEQLARVPGVDVAERVRCPRVPELEEEGTVIGTAAYMPPEQAWGRTAESGPRSDVFGLGAILYHVLSGAPPHGGAGDAIERAQRCEIAPLAPGKRSPRSLCRIAMKALARDPERRHLTVEALKHDLERVISGGTWVSSETFAPGTEIVREGEPGDAAYIIAAGRCEVSKLEGGQRVVLRHLGPGDVFGEAALFTGEARTATVTAVEETDVSIVSRDALQDELALSSWTAAFVRALAGRFRDIDGRLSDHRRALRALVAEGRLSEAELEALLRSEPER
jgi:CRP-like cAMP-binding protein/tRNA A-37 threonylcarbamoyl transferase component Bud32